MHHQQVSIPQFVLAVEGLDGSGKTTLVSALKHAFERAGHKVHVGDWFRQRQVQDLAMAFNKLDEMTPEILAALHATTTLFQLEEAKRSNCSIVLWDRYIYSSYASCRIRGSSQRLMQSIVSSFPEPNLTILLRDDPDICYRRVAERNGIRFFESGVDRLYRGRIANGLDLFQSEKLPQSLLREVFVHAGGEWYREIEEILLNKRVDRIEGLDVKRASALVDRVVNLAARDLVQDHAQN